MGLCSTGLGGTSYFVWMNKQNNFSNCLEPAITLKKYKYKIITSFADVLYMVYVPTSEWSKHSLSRLFADDKKSASRHTASTPTVFTVFRICFAWTQRIHVFCHILFVYTPVKQVPTGTLPIRSSFRCFIYFYSVYTQLMSTTFFLCLQSRYTRFIHFRCVYW
jgi:hypothetical protein